MRLDNIIVSSPWCVLYFVYIPGRLSSELLSLGRVLYSRGQPRTTSYPTAGTDARVSANRSRRGAEPNQHTI